MPTLAQVIDLTVQITVLVLVIMAYGMFRRKNFLWHAQVMTIAFVVILTSFLLIMVQSFVITFQTFTTSGTVGFDVASLAHVPFGAAGLILGGYLVVRWARNNFSLQNMKAPRLMRATLVLWVVNIVLGAVIFFTMPS